MKLNIVLSLYNLNGCLARIEDEDGDGVDIYKHQGHQNGERACVEAAKKLRELADKFDLLAESSHPFKCDTHDAINKE